MRFSKNTVASVEQGRRMPDPDFVARAEEALGNTGALRRAARHLSRQPAWPVGPGAGLGWRRRR